MTDFVRWLFLALAAGGLVPVASNVMRRSLTCEEELQDVGIESAICEKIRSAVSSVRQAVLDIDVKISTSAKEAIEEATEILRSSTKLLKEKLPMYLRRKRRSLDKQKREDQDDLSDFHDLAKRASSAAVQAVKDGSKEIRDALFQTIVSLHSKHDNVSGAARYILGKVISKRSTDEEAVGDALLRVSAKTKAAMTKAVLTALGGFKDVMDNMEVKMKTLLQDKVNIGFFDSSKAQIADLADRAGKDLVGFYDTLAIEKIREAILQVNDLMVVVYAVEKSIEHFDALFTLRDVVKAESQRVKDAIHSEEDNPEEGMALAMKNAADQMVLDYNDLVGIVNDGWCCHGK